MPAYPAPRALIPIAAQAARRRITARALPLALAMVMGTASAAYSDLHSQYLFGAYARHNFPSIPATTLGTCNASLIAVGNLSASPSCTWNPSDIAANRVAGPGELPEYTLRAQAAAVVPALNQLPALRVQAGIDKEARLGPIALAEAAISAQAGNRSLLVWDETVPVDSVVIGMHLTGSLAYHEWIGSGVTSSLDLRINATRGFLLTGNYFYPSPVGSIPGNEGFGRMSGQTTMEFAAAQGDIYTLNTVQSRTVVNGSPTAISDIEQFVPRNSSCGGAGPFGSGCDGTWESWSGSSYGPVERTLGITVVPVDLHIRVRLGLEFTAIFSGDEAPPTAPSAVRGVLMDVIMQTRASVFQTTYDSRSDILTFGQGLVEGDFGSTLQVESLQLMQGDTDVTAQARGMLANDLLEAQTLTYAAPVPEAESWLMLGAGLGLVGWLARRRRPDYT